MNRDADAIRAGEVAAARVLRTRLWRHEEEDVRQDGILGALEGLRRTPSAHFGYLVTCALNRIYANRLRRSPDEEGHEVVEIGIVNPWPQVDAAITVGQLAGALTPAELRAVTTEPEGHGRGNAPAHYKARSRAIWRMREKACA